MPDGMHLMIPASEYAEMESKIERLEKALDKACEELAIWFLFKKSYKFYFTKEQWKEWCMNDD